MTTPAPAPQTPWQLPRVARNFVNRERELNMLSGLADKARTGNGPTVAVLSGLAGVGKTATGLQWGHQHRDEFDGGQLYVDFADYRHRGGVDVGDILGAFLRALGVNDHYIPAALPERAALFRTKTSANRMLIILDNVQQPAQVHPLLPGAGAGMVLVISRRRLSGLLVDGAALVMLSPLNQSDGSTVVSGLLEPTWRGGDKPGIAELVRLCGGLPIALRVAAAQLAQSGRWRTPEHLVRHLSDERRRLARLSAVDDRIIQRIFDVAYEELPEPARRAYHVLGIHPGPDLDLHVVAAALDVPHDDAEDLLGVLFEANLLGEMEGDRFRPHDLIRLHARQHADAESAEAWEQVARRILDWYLRCAAAADIAVLGVSRWRLAQHNLSGLPFDFDAASGMVWFENERANLLAVVRMASEFGWLDLVWQLCEALWALYYSKKNYADWVEAYELAVRAVRETDNRVAEARMCNQLARARIELGEFEHAVRDLAEARDAALASQEPRALATVTESFGVLYREQGRDAASLAEFRRSLEINKSIGDTRGVALQHYHVGAVLVRMGRPQAALEQLEEADALFRQLGDDLSQTRLQIVRGRALHALGLDTTAAVILRSAAANSRRRCQAIKEVQALEVLSDLERLSQTEREAVSSRLHELYQQTGGPLPHEE